jgi:DNA-binding MarR family transcriptional regulator
MPLDPDRFQRLAEFRSALRKFLAASESISRAAGVTQQQYQALLAIRAWAPRPMTIRDLARELLLTHHATVQLVNRLEAAGVAERREPASDRRTVVIALTPSGLEKLDALAALHHAELLRQEPLLSQSLRDLRKAGRPDAP